MTLQVTETTSDEACPRCRNDDLDETRRRHEDRDFRCWTCGLCFTKRGGELHWDANMNDWRG